MKEEKPANYFEGILQLRDVSQEVIDFVEENCMMQGPRMVSKVKKVKNGFDFYIQSNKYLTKLGKLIRSNFDGELTKSASLHTKDKQSSKELYRLTILFREANFSKGDIITVKGERYQIIGISKDVLAKDLLTNKKKHFSFEQLRQLKARKSY